MRSDESFEQEVRTSLRATASEPAPERLIARIAGIPAREPQGRAGAGGLRLLARVAVNLAAAALIIVAVAALIVSRNGGSVPAGGQGPGSTPAATLGASPTTSATACVGLALQNAASPQPGSQNQISPGPTGSPTADGPVVVTLGIYSGRPDPAWTLSVYEAAAVDGMLAGLPDGTGTPPSGGLGYHGFTIARPGGVVVAYQGAVAAPGTGPRAMKTDPTRSIERCLLELSRSHVASDEYAIAEVAIAAPLATPPPATSPAPSPSSTPGPPSQLLGLSPVSVTFVSPGDGWVLGRGVCSSASCAAIARTADGGRTWLGGAAPDAPIFPGPSDVAPGVSGLRFADARNGWAFGPDLWATHDGGSTWARLAIPGLTGGTQVAALEAADGVVHAVVLDGTDYRVATSPIGTDDFQLSPVRVPVGAGPVPAVQLVLSGSAGWLLENDRTVVAGARLVNGTWTSWQPPCTDVVGPAYLAASSPTELAAACDVGLWGTPAGDHLYLSHDGGSRFVEAGATLPLQMIAEAAAASASTIVVAGSDASGALLVATFDAGRTWAAVARLGAVTITDLGFTTPTQGVAIATPEGGPASLLETRDGGRTWRAIGVAGG
jgi:hypothetical protein